jgi:hypothetical protein
VGLDVEFWGPSANVHLLKKTKTTPWRPDMLESDVRKSNSSPYSREEGTTGIFLANLPPNPNSALAHLGERSQSLIS